MLTVLSQAASRHPTAVKAKPPPSTALARRFLRDRSAGDPSNHEGSRPVDWRGLAALDDGSCRADEPMVVVARAGTPNECRARLREYEAAGCSYPVILPVTHNVDEMIGAFAPETSLARL